MDMQDYKFDDTGKARNESGEIIAVAKYWTDEDVRYEVEGIDFDFTISDIGSILEYFYNNSEFWNWEDLIESINWFCDLHNISQD